MTDKFFYVKALHTFEMKYIVKADTPESAEYMVKNMEGENIVGEPFDDKFLGMIVTKTKQVSENKAIQLVDKAVGFETSIVAGTLANEFIVRWNEGPMSEKDWDELADEMNMLEQIDFDGKT
jgi:hypothetical protein